MADRYAVIGNPVAHSKSPQIHERFARQTGQRLRYERIEAPLDGFGATLAAFAAAGGRGVNVTLPFKGEAWRLCADLSPRARAAQAVNTIVLDRDARYGDNTDGAGLVADLQANQGFSLAARRVLLLGAGGAAQGVIQPLLEAGTARLVVANRTPARALALAQQHAGVIGCGLAELAGQRFDLVVNATSAGLAGAALALPAGVLDEAALAYDMLYGRDTPFLAAARAAGVRAVDGLGMLVEQAAEAFALWRGIRPDTRPVIAALR